MKNKTLACMKHVFCLLILGLTAHVAHAACDDGDVKGLPSEDAAGCVSDTIDVGPSEYANVDEPPCPQSNDWGPDISKWVQDDVSDSAADGAAQYGGPFLGWAAQVTTQNALHTLENALGRDASSTTSTCGFLAVKVPRNRQIVAILGVAADTSNGRTYCGVENQCGGVGWASMRDQGQNGNIVYVTAMNWSHDLTRHFELLVYFN